MKYMFNVGYDLESAYHHVGTVRSGDVEVHVLLPWLSFLGGSSVVSCSVRAAKIHLGLGVTTKIFTRIDSIR